MDDLTLAAHLAGHAGRLLIDLRQSGEAVGRALGAAGDRDANAWLMRHVHHARPADAIMCEEEADSSARLSASRVWIIDPLDGTREYGEGRDDWAVHVALAIDGEARVGAVALPARGLVLTSGDAPIAYTTPARPRIVVSRSRPAAEAMAVADALGGALVPMGSAGAKAMAVVLGEADIYVHSGGQYEWDNAAPVAVARAAGLYCARIDGSPLVYNQPSPYLPDLVICHQSWRDAVMAALR